jgi:hypothetical protein
MSIFNLEKDQVVTLWVNQVMYPGIVTEVTDSVVKLDSIQYEGLKYEVALSALTAITIDTKADTREKLAEQKRLFDEKQKKAAEEMRAQAESYEAAQGNG